MIYRALLVLGVVAMGACEVLREIGDQCVDGVCEAAQTSAGPDCLVSNMRATLANDFSDGILPTTHFEPDERGLIPCEVFWTADDPSQPPAGLTACQGFLKPAGTDELGAARCRVHQVAAPDGKPEEAQGFYFEPNVQEPYGGLRYTRGVRLPPGVHAELSCTYARARDGGASASAVPVEQCARSAAALALDVSVGRSCRPSPLPEDGLSAHEISVDTADSGCSGGPCLVYHLERKPPESCDALDVEHDQCADPQSVAERVYCSCRCDLPAGQSGPRCECPSDFSCVPVFDSGPFAGSYCVRSDTIGRD